MGDHRAAQAEVLIRALLAQRSKSLHQLERLEGVGSKREVAALRRDVSEAETHLSNLHRLVLSERERAPIVAASRSVTRAVPPPPRRYR